MRIFTSIGLALISSGFIACNLNEAHKTENNDISSELLLEAINYKNSSFEVEEDGSTILIKEDQWLSYEMDVKQVGRYKVEVNAKADSSAYLWIEDYIDNKDDRTYDITGKIAFDQSASLGSSFIDGSPLSKGLHKIKVHVSDGNLALNSIKFTLIQEFIETKIVHKQNMEGKDWSLVWSDEFSGTGLPDSTKWSYNIGNWGWGNNEPQYYTNSNLENARLENGNLIIEAKKTGDKNEWTSARLSTQGKESFVYGKIEFRAKVPVGRGTWAAGWLLGDEYRDEMSWPYCGEIDVLECVGFEINDSTGNGKNHATCHTRAYYFKQGNQIGADIEVQSMNSEFHTYSIEWYPDVIYGLVDGKRFYTYDKNKNELEWPFHKPQNIILNLAIGGGWGGAKGIDENWDNHQYIIDYVRVYELK
jgi:beta-glucanase (GH16 family)